MSLSATPPGLTNLRTDLTNRLLACLWPWDWRIAASASSTVRKIVRKGDDVILSQLPVDAFESNVRLRRFIVQSAERGDRRWLLALASADPAAVDSLKLLHAAIRGGQVECVAMLLRIGADADGEDDHGSGPMHVAAQGGNPELVALLAEQRADIAARSSHHGGLPLTVAASCGQTEACRILLEARADVEAAGSQGLRPLAVAAGSGALTAVRMLVEARADAMAWSGNNRTTPLHEAARKGHESIVSALLSSDADVHALTFPAEDTPLHLACRSGWTEAARALLKADADPNAVNDRGQTPLGIARAASSKDGPARAAFKAMHEILSAAGAGLGAFNPTLYSGASSASGSGHRSKGEERNVPTQPPLVPTYNRSSKGRGRGAAAPKEDARVAYSFDRGRKAAPKASDVAFARSNSIGVLERGALPAAGARISGIRSSSIGRKEQERVADRGRGSTGISGPRSGR